MRLDDAGVCKNSNSKRHACSCSTILSSYHTKCRYREFFQCDFDVAGAYATMVADSEVVKVLVEILQVSIEL